MAENKTNMTEYERKHDEVNKPSWPRILKFPAWRNCVSKSIFCLGHCLYSSQQWSINFSACFENRVNKKENHQLLVPQGICWTSGDRINQLSFFQTAGANATRWGKAPKYLASAICWTCSLGGLVWDGGWYTAAKLETLSHPEKHC